MKKLFCFAVWAVASHRRTKRHIENNGLEAFRRPRLLLTLIFATALMFARTTPSAELEFCLTYPAPDAFALWVRGIDNADHAGLAGFSVTLNRSVATFNFDSLFVALAGATEATIGFDLLGAGSIGTQFNIYGVQTHRSPNTALFDLGINSIVVDGKSGDVSLGVPLRVGTGTYSGMARPAIESMALAGNVFEPARDGRTFNSSSSMCCFVAAGDQDSDGLPDCWETKFFGDAMRAEARADADGDGASNLHEYIADTDPTQAESVSRIASIRLESGGIEITFPTALGREYRLQFNADLSSPPGWRNLGPVVVGDGQMHRAVAAESNEAMRYYRVAIAIP